MVNRSMRLVTSLLFALSLSVAFAQNAPVKVANSSAPKIGNVEAIRADRLKAHLEFIANDLLEGRNTPSRGLDIATWYVATQLKLWGAQPAGDNGTFFQDINLKEGPSAHNVVAIIPGSDPVLKDEYVAVGAHIDHVGMNPNLPGDKIYNGADDDGSGTVAVLELAHAFLTGPRPKRSILLVWHCGEEKGLWGSAYFTEHPTVPRGNIICQLNIDMIGRSRRPGDENPANANLTSNHSIYVIGAKRLSSEFSNLVDGANQSLYKMTFDRKYDAPNDPENFYQRSDHYNYARFNIPVAFFFSGVHEDYHQLSDEVSKIDFAKMELVARTVYAVAWATGNVAKRPKLDQYAKS